MTLHFIDTREKWEGKSETVKKFSEKYKTLLSFLYYLDIIISMKNNYREKKSPLSKLSRSIHHNSSDKKLEFIDQIILR